MVQQFNWTGDDTTLQGYFDWAGDRQNMKSASGGVINADSGSNPRYDEESTWNQQRADVGTMAVDRCTWQR